MFSSFKVRIAGDTYKTEIHIFRILQEFVLNIFLKFIRLCELLE